MVHKAVPGTDLSPCPALTYDPAPARPHPPPHSMRPAPMTEPRSADQRQKDPVRSKHVSATVRIVVGLVLFAGLAGIAFSQVRLDVPYVPTPQEVVDRMLDMAKLTK